MLSVYNLYACVATLKNLPCSHCTTATVFLMLFAPLLGSVRAIWRTVGPPHHIKITGPMVYVGSWSRTWGGGGVKKVCCLRQGTKGCLLLIGT